MRIEREIVTTILQCEACALRRDACAKTHVVRVDERASIARAIYDAKVHGIRGCNRSTALLIHRGLFRVDHGGALAGIVITQKLSEWDIEEVRVSNIPGCISE